MTLDQIVDAMWAAIDAAPDDAHIGVRGDTATVRRQFRPSFNRPDGERTTRLPGICVVYVGYDQITRDTLRRAVTRAAHYGTTLYLIAGESPTHLQYLANDPQERIFTTHKILWRGPRLD